MTTNLFVDNFNNNDDSESKIVLIQCQISLFTFFIRKPSNKFAKNSIEEPSIPT